MTEYSTPGVYQEYRPPQRENAEVQTGVPVFVGRIQGYVSSTVSKAPWSVLDHWEDFEQLYQSAPGSYLGAVIRGFFHNGGRRCYVVPLSSDLFTTASLDAALESVQHLDMVDLICVPDLMRPPHEKAPLDPDDVRSLQTAILKHCDQMCDRFAILDAIPGDNPDQAIRHRKGLVGMNGALYYPWIKVSGANGISDHLVPPCGHVAGVYSRTDREHGVHKAPANQQLLGVLDVEIRLTHAQQGPLNNNGINCLRSLPGRGICVWGARTLSHLPDWTYVSVRRLFLTVGRWIQRNMAEASFEPMTENLWARIERDLTTYFTGLLQRGALKGASPEEAFFVKCNGETNPIESREAGRVVTQIGLSPRTPNEFVVVSIIQTASGATIDGPDMSVRSL